jgi:hypothetical protein
MQIPPKEDKRSISSKINIIKAKSALARKKKKMDETAPEYDEELILFPGQWSQSPQQPPAIKPVVQPMPQNPPPIKQEPPQQVPQNTPNVKPPIIALVL